MSNPPGQYGGSPEWQGQQPGWPGQQPGGYPAQQPYQQGQQEPNNYLVWAILCTVLCCLPFGIVSIVYSSRVSGLWSQGRYGEAQQASANARKWAIIGAISGPVLYILLSVLWVVFIAAVISNTPSTPTTTTPSFSSF